ncbi:diguanylate cyclase [Leptospira wolffii]|uniref:diguanylate cyclase n=1 Tax=Leptospira wolffii TaxID=409998 RepID=A0A2M9ZCY6_9LEPT|nr:sensor domain-containing diguanylate cyclase [Leptospira wolffii]EPG68168.1 diguanylate cyclase (GGDEF) domain protein [Leptospira wolffii serovar Khorat str. Khorat-H2]PJZ66234.1 sensor domain-containing diguanylate cyclase [Leptospira wolffii]TGL46609.1 sensor domain-containing diguanylate cyclase [Leptospira wolffii]
MIGKDNDPLMIEYYEKKIYDQKQLLEISKALNSTLDYKYLIDAILNICLAQLQTLSAAIFLAPEADSNYFELEPSFKGFDLAEDDSGFKIKTDAPLITFLETKLKAMTPDQVEEAMGLSPELEFLRRIGGDLIIPLNAKGKVNGLLLLGEKITMGEWMEEDRDFLTTLSTLAGIAVENSRLYELATVDMMTGLKVHHYFQTKLKEEMERCRKKRTNLALLFTDVDNFKKFNDTHGHQAGDQVLIEVARQLIQCAGKHDIAARYGGEEFCLVMPGADLKRGFEMGERLRKAVESSSIPNPNGGPDFKVTLSIGVSEFWASDRNNKDLIERADKALYEAKHSGKNRTVSFEIPVRN